MLSEKEKICFSFEDDILELIENQLRDNNDTLTRSDLQGVVSVLVKKIYSTGEAGK